VVAAGAVAAGAVAPGSSAIGGWRSASAGGWLASGGDSPDCMLSGASTICTGSNAYGAVAPAPAPSDTPEASGSVEDALEVGRAPPTTSGSQAEASKRSAVGCGCGDGTTTARGTTSGEDGETGSARISDSAGVKGATAAALLLPPLPLLLLLLLLLLLMLLLMLLLLPAALGAVALGFAVLWPALGFAVLWPAWPSRVLLLLLLLLLPPTAGCSISRGISAFAFGARTHTRLCMMTFRVRRSRSDSDRRMNCFMSAVQALR